MNISRFGVHYTPIHFFNEDSFVIAYCEIVTGDNINEDQLLQESNMDCEIDPTFF